MNIFSVTLNNIYLLVQLKLSKQPQWMFSKLIQLCNNVFYLNQLKFSCLLYVAWSASVFNLPFMFLANKINKTFRKPQTFMLCLLERLFSFIIFIVANDSKHRGNETFLPAVKSRKDLWLKSRQKSCKYDTKVSLKNFR